LARTDFAWSVNTGVFFSLIDYPERPHVDAFYAFLFDLICRGRVTWPSKAAPAAPRWAVCSGDWLKAAHLAMMCCIAKTGVYGGYNIDHMYMGGSHEICTPMLQELFSERRQADAARYSIASFEFEFAKKFPGMRFPIDIPYMIQKPHITELAKLCEQSGDLAVCALLHLLAVLHDLDVPVYVAEQIVLYTKHSAYVFLGGHAKFIAHAAGVYRSIDNVRNARDQPAKRIRLHE
jgi:hypothetical protein